MMNVPRREKKAAARAMVRGKVDFLELSQELRDTVRTNPEQRKAMKIWHSRPLLSSLYTEIRGDLKSALLNQCGADSFVRIIDRGQQSRFKGIQAVEAVLDCEPSMFHYEPSLVSVSEVRRFMTDKVFETLIVRGMHSRNFDIAQQIPMERLLGAFLDHKLFQSRQ